MLVVFLSSGQVLMEGLLSVLVLSLPLLVQLQRFVPGRALAVSPAVLRLRISPVLRHRISSR